MHVFRLGCDTLLTRDKQYASPYCQLCCQSFDIDLTLRHIHMTFYHMQVHFISTILVLLHVYMSIYKLYIWVRGVFLMSSVLVIYVMFMFMFVLCHCVVLFFYLIFILHVHS